MNELFEELCAVCLALLQTNRCTSATLREHLTAMRDGHLAPGDAAGLLLARVQVSQPEINGTLSSCRRAIDGGRDLGILPIPILSNEYPAPLRLIGNAPPLIFLRGSLKALSLIPGIAVAGTRKASPHGLTIAERISTFIGNSGVSVVSGLALGIAAAAHEGALKTAMPTIAVLGHGLEQVRPRALAHLADRILEHGGAWVSEHPCGTTVRPEYFVSRNRIQVGLACASIIVEGGENSSSLAQAEFCIQNRRPLFAVLPEFGGVVMTQQKLPQMLVANQGATAVRSKADYAAMLEKALQRRTELITSANNMALVS